MRARASGAGDAGTEVSRYPLPLNRHRWLRLFWYHDPAHCSYCRVMQIAFYLNFVLLAVIVVVLALEW